MNRGNTIGSRIEELRRGKDMTQAELAEAMSVELGRTVYRENIVQWESNSRDVKAQVIIALAKLFSVSCDYILRGIKAENADIYTRLGVNDTAIEAIERLQHYTATGGNSFLNMLFGAGFESIVAEYQSLFYSYIGAKKREEDFAVEHAGQVFTDAFRIKNIIPACDGSGKAIPGLYQMTLNVEGYFDVRLQQIGNRLNLLMNDMAEKACIEAKKRAALQLDKIITEISERERAGESDGQH